MNKVLNLLKIAFDKIASQKSSAARTLLACVFVWCCLVKLPATGLREWQHDSWEPVASYAVAHHLQWGRDIVFTYGPLGFLTTDYYWGNFFWPIVIWAGAFALIVTTAIVPLLGKLPRAIRLALYATLPLLTVPTCLNLVFDSLRVLSMTVLGIACLSDERPGVLRLITTGLVFTVLSLTKFTYCVYFAFAFIIIAASNRRVSWRNTAILAASSLVSFLWLCFWSGQSIANIFLHFARSAQMAAGYSAAMAINPEGFDLPAGIIALVILVGLASICWLGSSNWRGRTDRAAIIAAAIFLIWKEGFVRADDHVIAFFLHVFFLAALLPALLRFHWPAESERLDSGKHSPGQDAAALTAPLENPSSGEAVSPRFCSTSSPRNETHLNCIRIIRRLFAPHVLTLTAICMLFSLTYLLFCNKYSKTFKAAIHNGLVARNRNTFNAYLRPATYKVELEHYLETLRHEVALSEIRAIVGNNPVGAMNLDQEVAILNDLNYAPHPIFENYAAYTPELQRINSEFFNSQKAPEYLLWHTGSVDGRFPTMDDGEVLLRILNNYSPVIQEKGALLWKRKSTVGNSYCLSNARECYGSLEKWIAIPADPTWLRIECKPTLRGAIQGLLWRPSELQLEVQLDDGDIRNYQLLPGNARYGFLISPFIRADFQLIEAARASGDFAAGPAALPKTFRGEPRRIVAARVRAANEFAYKQSVRFVMQTIQGIWPLRGVSPATESNEFSRVQ
jgi:hypothetical protein